MVSLRDVLKAIHDGNTTGKLSDIAFKSLVYEGTDASVEDIANLIVSKYVGLVALLEGEPKAANLRGTITEWDLVRLYATMVGAHVLIEAEPSKVRGLVAASTATPRVYDVMKVHGPHDLLVTIGVEDPDSIGTTVVNSTASMAGVKEITTLVEADLI